MGIVNTFTFTSDTESVTDVKLNNLVNNLLVEFNGNTDNANIATGANIAASKLNLSTISESVTFSLGTTSPNAILTNSGNGPHLRMTGDPTVASPTDGDMWYTGSALNFRDGSTTVDLLAGTSVAFLAKNAGGQNNLATGSDVTIAYGNEITDTGSNFASNTFTAPSTGNYLLNASVRLGSIDSASSAYSMKIITSNRTYTYTIDPSQFAGDLAFYTFTMSVVADMDTSDTAIVAINQSGGTAQSDVSSESFFSGALV